MLDKLRALFRWIYDWITVITASLIGLPALALEFFSYFSGVDIAPLVGPDRAMKIVTAVALLKGVLAFAQSKAKA